MKIHIEIDTKKGLIINGHIQPAVLRALLTIIAGMAALPWLTQFGHALGWM